MIGDPSLLRQGPVRAVLFDYGRTLVEVVRPVAAIEQAQQAIARCIAGAGHPAPSPALLLARVHDRVEAEVSAHEEAGHLEEIDIDAAERRAFADIGLDLADDLRDRCASIAQRAWFESMRLCPGVVDVLGELRAGGLRIGLCSNAPYRPSSMHEQLRHVGVAGLLDAAIFSGEVGWRKPSERIFRAALSALHADAATTVFVGDRLREDVAGASAAGMRTILVRRGEPGEPPRDGPAPDAVVDSLRALPRLLLEHRSGR